jgi:hypothetical protein
MTAAQLAALGYQPSMGSSDLNSATSSVSPQDLQQFYQTAGNPVVVPMASAGTQSQVDPALLAQLMGSAPASDQQNMVNANQLQMMSTMGVIPESDPNGLTSAQPQVVDAPGGGTMTVPPNTRAANTDGGSPAPVQSSETPAEPGFYTWAKQNYGLTRGQQITVQEKLKAMELYADYQKELLKQQDPKTKLETKKIEGDIAAQTTAATNASQEQLDKYNTKQTALDQVDDTITKIDELIAHPGRAWISGGTSILPNAPGSNGADAQAKYELIKSRAFMDARQQLRGTGSISDMESKAAGQAASALSTRQSEPEFLKTLNEMKGVLTTGRTRLSDQMKSMPRPSADSSTPPTSKAAPSDAPVIRTTPRGTFQSLGNGRWVQIK